MAHAHIKVYRLLTRMNLTFDDLWTPQRVLNITPLKIGPTFDLF